MSRFQIRSLIQNQQKSAFVSRSTKEHATDVQDKQISFYILNCCQLRKTELELHLKKTRCDCVLKDVSKDQH